MADLQRHYAQLLGLTNQWQVGDVQLLLDEQRVEIAVSYTGDKAGCCPQCGRRCGLYDLREERRWRHLDTMQFETLIRCRLPRCHCPEHGVRTVRAPWAAKHARFTLLFEAFAVQVLLACGTVEAARKLLKLSWQQLDEIRTRAVERGLQRRKAEPITYMGLDEKSFKSNHSYISVLSDLQGRRIVEVAEGRDEATAQGLFETLSEQQKQGTRAIAVDMWPAYMNAARAQLPAAVVVHDKFHVIRHLNVAVDEVRKRENRLLRQRRDQRLKGTKYLWLRNPEKLSDQANLHFHKLRDSGLKVAHAWSLKELFREFWQLRHEKAAHQFFEHWYDEALQSRMFPVTKVARTLKRHLKGLLGYATHPITNAMTEGFNSKIQYIKASARGFRSFEKYRIAILFHCGKLDLTPALHKIP